MRRGEGVLAGSSGPSMYDCLADPFVHTSNMKICESMRQPVYGRVDVRL